VTDGLRHELTLLLQSQHSKSFDPELDLKKSILSSMTSSGDDTTTGSLNLKKIQ
jgi:hypothetical protein